MRHAQRKKGPPDPKMSTRSLQTPETDVVAGESRRRDSGSIPIRCHGPFSQYGPATSFSKSHGGGLAEHGLYIVILPVGPTFR